MNKTVELEVSNVLTAHEGANRKGKQLLENLLPKLFIKDIREIIKTIPDAYKHLGKSYDQSIEPDEQIKVLVKALNGDWEADYSDPNQKKYYIWWKYTAGSGFSLNGVFYGSSRTTVGAPFVFKNNELATYAATNPNFVKVYNEMLTQKTK